MEESERYYYQKRWLIFFGYFTLKRQCNIIVVLVRLVFVVDDEGRTKAIQVLTLKEIKYFVLLLFFILFFLPYNENESSKNRAEEDQIHR